MIDTKPVEEPMHLVLNEEDLAYEEEILRNPHSIKPWIRYIEHKADAPKNMLNLVFERALKELPGSYKLCKIIADQKFAFSMNDEAAK